jgi:hypothetical protein
MRGLVLSIAASFVALLASSTAAPVWALGDGPGAAGSASRQRALAHVQHLYEAQIPKVMKVMKGLRFDPSKVKLEVVSAREYEEMLYKRVIDKPQELAKARGRDNPSRWSSGLARLFAKKQVYGRFLRRGSPLILATYNKESRTITVVEESLAKDSKDRVAQLLAHELAHAVMHQNPAVGEHVKPQSKDYTGSTFLEKARQVKRYHQAATEWMRGVIEVKAVDEAIAQLVAQSAAAQEEYGVLKMDKIQMRELLSYWRDPGKRSALLGPKTQGLGFYKMATGTVEHKLGQEITKKVRYTSAREITAPLKRALRSSKTSSVQEFIDGLP